VEIVGDLLKHKANTETRGFSGCNALEWVVYKDHAEVARHLRRYGADVKAQDGNENTSLYWALERGNLAAAQALIRQDADVKALCKNNQTLLHWVKGEEAARLLIEHGLMRTPWISRIGLRCILHRKTDVWELFASSSSMVQMGTPEMPAMRHRYI